MKKSRPIMIIMMKKVAKGPSVYHTFTGVTFTVLLPAVGRFPLVIEWLTVQGPVFIPVSEDL